MRSNQATVIKGSARLKTRLQVGDTVMVLCGGNSVSGKELKGKTGRILRFIPKKGRVVVEGLNLIKRHQRATSATNPGGIVQREASLHISNVMYYSSDLRKPVKIVYRDLEDGRKVRGYMDSSKEKFEQIDI
jgi:large subunit ribosomal protein L24